MICNKCGSRSLVYDGGAGIRAYFKCTYCQERLRPLGGNPEGTCFRCKKAAFSDHKSLGWSLDTGQKLDTAMCVKCTCGVWVPYGTAACTGCAAELSYTKPEKVKPVRSGMDYWLLSIIFATVALRFFGFIFGVFAIVYGAKSISKKEKWSLLALVGVILGIIGFVYWLGIASQIPGFGLSPAPPLLPWTPPDKPDEGLLLAFQAWF